MNRKQLISILVAVVVFGGLGLWLHNRRAGSYVTTTGNMGQKVMGDFDLNTAAQITIKHGTNELNLVSQNEVWTVRERGGYPANFSEVSEFLRKAWDLKVVQPVRIGPSQLGRLELEPPGTAGKGATLVEIKDKDGKVLRSLYLGKKHMRQASSPSPLGGDEGWPDGRYVMVDNKPETVSLVSETFSNLEPKPDQWLSKDFFKVEKVKSVRVTYPAGTATNSFALSRETETGELKLADAKPDEQLDNSKVSGIPTALSWPSFNDVVVDPKPAELGLDQPTVAVLETFDGFTYTLKAGKKPGEENYYLNLEVNADFPKERTPGTDEKPEDKEKLDKEFKEKTDKLAEKLKQEKALERWTFNVNKWTLDSLLKERHALMAEKKAEPPPASIAAPGATNAPPATSLVPPLPPPSSADAIVPPLPPPAEVKDAPKPNN